ncbi:ankyrin repeat protein [Fowlpox virus]|nr:ankyrin repeat protein [Fowlpox virus]
MDIDTNYISMYLYSDDKILSNIKLLGKKYDIDNEIVELMETIELDDDYGVYSIIYSPDTPLHQAIESRRVNIVDALLKQKRYTANSMDTYSKFYPLHLLTSIPETNAVLDRIIDVIRETDDVNILNDIIQCKDIIIKAKNRAMEMNLYKSVSVAIIKEVFQRLVLRRQTNLTDFVESSVREVNSLKGNIELTDDDLRRIENQIKKDELKIAELLLSKGAKVNVTDRNSFTPLRNAVINGSLELTKLFLSRGANTKLEYNGLTIFEVSALSPNVDVVKEIVTVCGYDVYSDILIDASERGYANVIKYLLDIGLSVRTNNCGETPLHRAASVGSLEVVDVLLSYGAKVNAKDIIGTTPLMCGSAYTDIVKLLIGKGADINIADINGCTALHNAAKYGSLKSIDLFISYGVDVDVKDNIGNTPLFYALPYPDAVKMLLEKGANPNIVNSRGLTPLSRAMEISDLSTKHIVSHIVLLEHRNIFNNKILTANTNLIEKNILLTEIKISCEKELERMKSIRINNKHSLIVFITIDNISFLSKLVKNTVVDSIEAKSFQIYGSLLNKSINAAIRLRNKFETAIYVVSSELEDTLWKMLPIEIQSQILSMLGESELPHI